MNINSLDSFIEAQANMYVRVMALSLKVLRRK